MFKSLNKGPLFMAAAAFCWSLGGLLFKFIPWNAMSIIGLRALFAAIVFAVFRKSIKVNLTRGNILAALFLSATTILFVFSNRLTTAAAAVMLQFTAPIFILLIQFIFYKKKPKISEAVAVVVTILGMALFFADGLYDGRLLGNILAVTSGLTFAFVFVCNQRPDTQPEQSVMLGFLINAVIFTPFVLFDTNITAEIVPWILITIMGVVQVGFAYVFFTISIRTTPALLACLIVALEPVLNPIWVALFTPERPGRYAVIGGVIIVTTVVAYNMWVAKRDALNSKPASKKR